jgi:hypothetical protein
MHEGRLHNLYSLINIIKVIKSMGTRWAGHVAYTGRHEMHIKYYPENVK